MTFQVSDNPKQYRVLSSAVYAAITSSADTDADVTLTGESGGCEVRAVYRRGARVEFACCDAADSKLREAAGGRDAR